METLDAVVDYFPAGPERGESANGKFLEIRVILGIPLICGNHVGNVCGWCLKQNELLGADP